MALPVTFNEPDTYFSSALRFLRQYAWIYEHANTRCIAAGVLERMPSEFQEYFRQVSNEELNQFPLVHCQLDLPAELETFRKMLCDLIPVAAFEEPLVHMNASLARPLRKVGKKKQHEIRLLAQLIREVCGPNDLLIDYGAGLGYLSEAIFTLSPRCLLLCLESDEQRVEAARQRLRANLPAMRTPDSIRYQTIYISDQSRATIECEAERLAVANHLTDPRMAIIGLHACADLTITAIRHFLHMTAVRNLIIMPCCYHKLQLATLTSPTAFVNFPLSAVLREAVEAEKEPTIDGGKEEVLPFLNRPFLRLACQQTLARWQTCTVAEHDRHAREMYRRALAEAIANADTELVAKRRIPMSSSAETFTSLCREYELRSKISGEPVSWSSEHERRHNEIIRQHCEGHRLVEGLTCLQTTMQKLCENIVLYDRLCYIKEEAERLGVNIRVRYQKLLNEKLSPRCYVLIATKQ